MKQGKAKAFLQLRATSAAARQQLESGITAKNYLSVRVLLARKNGPSLMRAQRHLQSAIAEVRLKLSIEAACVKAPQRLAELVGEVRADDRRKAAERKGLGLERRLKIEMMDCFSVFDLDGSGEIDFLEFRALVRSGSLFKFPRVEIEDLFAVIDRDGSGSVSFDEFWRWFHFEHLQVKTPNSRPFTAALLIPARDRAARLLYLELKAETKRAMS